MFPLPNVHARLAILNIHTRQWAKPPPQDLKADLARKCVGYCGADLKVPCCINGATYGRLAADPL